MDYRTQNEIEQAILASVMNKPHYLNELGITQEYFLIDLNRKIFEVIKKCYDKEHKEILLASLPEVLNNNELDYYFKIQDSFVSDVQLENYIKKLSDNYKHFKMEKALELYKTNAIDDVELMKMWQDLNETSLFAVEEPTPTPEEIYKMVTSKNDVLEFKQYKVLGSNVRFEQGALHVIGARTGVGKSTLALNLMNDLSQNQKYKCIYFNIEMGEDSLYKRLIGMNGRIKLNNLNTSTAQDITKIWDNIRDRNITFKNSALYIEDLNSQILREQRKIENKNKHIIVFIDYLGLVRTKGRYNSDRERIGQMVRDMRAVTQDRKCTMFLLVQLNRSVEDDPKLEHLKDSGEVEQTAHTVILLSDETYKKNKNTNEPTHTMRLSVAKNRTGSLCQMFMKFHKETQLFVEMTRQEIEQELAK